MIEQGIYPNLDNEAYHGDKASLSRTSLKDFYRNPYYYYAHHLSENKPVKEKTNEMILGSAFHALVLEPQTFNDLYAIEPQRVLLKDVGRELYDAYKAECEALEASKKIILTAEEYKNLLAMQESLKRNPKVEALLTGGEIEKSYFWKDPHTDLMVKARPDILHENMIVDLKTIADASPFAFQRSMVDGWYHVQGAMIRDAVRILENKTINTVINICVEKKYPYCVAVYIIDEVALDCGESQYKNVLLNMKSCIINNTFTDFEVQSIGLPKWSM